ncbi:hypothetical protein [Desulfoluna spongiiphila]|uniref:hypothetical protein n=1 Tax=Desulfoluna spongiiphila TaxID=419481 RepID=UPI00125BCD95|nr:hypothetical protein [Desulfoluna spongiiphila]VVS94868.1 hypothetical protein DBB_44400 [Desulfoluna spongiiphila]
MAEIILLCVGLVSIVFLALRLPRAIRWTIWSVVLLQLFAMIALHYLAVAKDPSGIIHGDSSVDTRKYYYTMAELSDNSAGIVSPKDIAEISGTVFHPGYYYMNFVAFKVSNQPMLFLRLLKLFLFFAGLIAMAKYWFLRFGTRLSILGIAYLSFGYWELFYYNFRNLKDGVIVSLSLVVLGLLGTTFLLMQDGQIRQRTHVKLMGGLIAIACLGLLFTFRVYWAAILGAGIVADVLFQKRMKKNHRVMFIALLFLGALVCSVDFFSAARYGLRVLFERGVFDLSALSVIFFKGFVSPVPWQYFNHYLVFSQFLYLVVLGLGLRHLFFVRKKPLAQALMVFLLILFVAAVTHGSFARKRMPVVPIVVTWMLAGFSVAQKRRYVRNYDKKLLSDRGTMRSADF